jgi:glyoxylate utilization-related uncharacterized protein
LQNYGVVMTRIVPGGQSSHRHAHSRQDEFIYVLEGEVTLETNAGQQILTAGMCAGFPAGTGDGHRFVNHSSADTVKGFGCRPVAAYPPVLKGRLPKASREGTRGGRRGRWPSMAI